MAIGLAAFAALIALIMIGVPIAFALGVTALLGVAIMDGTSGLPALANITWGASSEFVLTAIPLFVLMSELISATGIGRDLFHAVEKWFGRMKGGMAITGILACAIFGAVSGSAVGVAAVIGAIAIPEMLKRGYSRQLATGSIAAASPLGMIIPPSLPMILYGVVTETPIDKLFIAGILPGLMIAALGCAYVMVVSLGESEQAPEAVSFREKLLALRLAGPVIILILLVIGTIYTGVATPTEAAAVGVGGTLAIAAIQRSLSWASLIAAVKTSARVSSMLLIVIVGAMLFGYLLGLSQLPQLLTESIVDAGLSKWTVFVLIMLAYFVLGMFLEVTSIILITVPVIFPTVLALGFDPVWFAVILMINMSFAVVTPPVGLCLFVTKSCAPGTTLKEVIQGTMPFMVIYVAVAVLLCIFPQLVTS